MNYESILSQRVQNLKPSGIRRFFDLAATMEGVISLGVGEPDFSTPLEYPQRGYQCIGTQKNCIHRKFRYDTVKGIHCKVSGKDGAYPL